MKLSRIAGQFGVVFIVACTTVMPANVPAPVSKPGDNPAQAIPPISSPTLVTQPVTHTGPWKFTYAPGAYVYTLKTDAIIAPVSDTIQKRQIPELNQQITLMMSATGDLQIINPVPSSSNTCDTAAALITRAQQLVPRIPDHFSAGNHWRDSTTTSGCRGIIPTTSQIVSNYTVVGDTTFANTAVVQIHRVDSLTANGEGTEGQHRILITATGSGIVDLFFNTTAGILVGSNSLQTSVVSVTTSGRLTQFLQQVKASAILKGQ